MSSIDVLAAILSSREETIRGAAFGDPTQLRPLLSAGIIMPAGSVRSILCTECSAPHAAEVESNRSRTGWYCQEAGFVPVDLAVVAAFSVQTDVLAQRMHTALGIKGRLVSWPTGAPILWSIGTFDFRRLAVAVYLVPNLADLAVFNELNRYLESPHGHPHGIAVLASDQRKLEAVHLPGHTRVMQLGDVCAMDEDGKLTVDAERIAHLALPASLLRPPFPGRPPRKRELAVSILGDLDRAGKLDGKSGHAIEALVLAELRNRLDHNATLGRSTFLDALRSYSSRSCAS
jgi:hypothetical protein